MTSFWLGHPGALLPIPDRAVSLSRSTERVNTFATSASGRRRAYQTARVGLREWKVSVSRLRPTESAVLHELLNDTDPPYVWVDPWSQVTNLMSPASALMQDCIPELAYLGRQPLADGGFATTARANPEGDPVTLAPAPVETGLPVTASAYLSAGTVTVVFLDQAGATVSETQSEPVIGVEALIRAHVSVLQVPAAAAAVALRIAGASVIARPAVTWTTELVDYGAGGGAAQVVLGAIEEAPVWAMTKATGQRWADTQFTVTEVG